MARSDPAKDMITNFEDCLDHLYCLLPTGTDGLSELTRRYYNKSVYDFKSIPPTTDDS
jgi:hypothetical protein